MPFDLVYPTPIYHSVVDDLKFQKIQDDFKKVFDDLKSKGTFEKKETWCNGSHSLSDTTFTKNLVKEYNLTTFENELRKHVCMFVDKGSDFRIDSSWMTLTRKGEYSHTHSHGAADISGVYYFDTNGKDGNIYFESPVKALGASYVFADMRRAYYTPRNGLLLMFPGFLEHGVFQNTTDHERISVSFNIYFAR